MDWTLATTIVATTCAITLFTMFRERAKEKKRREQLLKENENMEKAKTQEIKSATRSLVQQVLKNIGCQTEITQEGRIRYDYQGITFLIEAADDCLFVNLIFPWCYSFSRFDIDEFARVRRVVNNINSHSNCTIFYTTNAETDEIAVHVRKHLIFTSQIQDLEGYLIATMGSFFNIVRELNLEIEKVRMKECEK